MRPHVEGRHLGGTLVPALSLTMLTACPSRSAPRRQPGLMRRGCDLISGGSSLVPIWSTLGPRGTRRQGTAQGQVGDDSCSYSSGALWVAATS